MRNFRLVPVSYGKRWLVGGWQIFNANRMAFLLPVALYLIVLSLASVPLLGAVVAIFGPLLVGGILKGVATSMGQREVRINLLSLWDDPDARNNLLLLGAGLYLLSQLIFLTFGMNQVQLEDIFFNPDPEAGSQLRQKVMLVMALNMSLVSVLSWFSIPLIALGKYPVTTAIALGFAGMLANWKALVMLSIGYLSLILAGVFLVLLASMLLVAVLAGLPFGSYLAMLPVFAFFLVVFTFGYIVQYLCWRDIFDSGSKTETSDSEEPPPSRVVI